VDSPDRSWLGNCFPVTIRGAVSQSRSLKLFLISLHQMGYKVVIFTVIDTEAVWDWLRKFDLHVHIDDVTNSKPPAVAYIDDRAINFNGNYQDALNALKGFKSHWE